MKIARKTINELLKLGFNPSTLIVQDRETYITNESDFKAFADGKGWEKGLDYTISGDTLTANIVLQPRGSAPARTRSNKCGNPNCPVCYPQAPRQPTSEEKMDALRAKVRMDLRTIKDEVSSGTHCKNQLKLIKDILMV